MLLALLFFSARVVERLTLSRAVPLRVIADTDVNDLAVLDRTDASAGRNVFDHSVLGAVDY